MRKAILIGSLMLSSVAFADFRPADLTRDFDDNEVAAKVKYSKDYILAGRVKQITREDSILHRVIVILDGAVTAVLKNDTGATTLHKGQEASFMCYGIGSDKKLGLIAERCVIR